MERELLKYPCYTVGDYMCGVEREGDRPRNDPHSINQQCA